MRSVSLPSCAKNNARSTASRSGTEPLAETEDDLDHGDPYVPTWWTAAPAVAPMLTAWAGGHAADRMLAEGGDAMTDRALDALAAILGVARRRIASMLVAAHMHDWQADPFSRGAYSYAGVGGSGAHRELAKPLAGTLFLSGEATSDQTGTSRGRHRERPPRRPADSAAVTVIGGRAPLPNPNPGPNML